LLVHPSLYEGFGLPPLEAMACGTPVVYANTSSLTELIGGAGYAVEPSSAEALAAGIRELLEHQTLRETFIRQGLQHVQRYSWDAATQKVLELYAAK
jgi:glycosyltransferase involved in cell wall biosynthesis